jgi:ribosomal protein L11 methyltransferase
MIELVLRVPGASAEALSDALVDAHGALSASVEDAAAGGPSEQALFGEPGMALDRAAWSDTRLLALFDSMPAAERVAAVLLATDPSLRIEALRPLADRDWVRLTQGQFAPSEIEPGFWIVPSWHAPPTEATRVLRLDPGMAFGTGTHPTTRMCLRWLASRSAATGARWERVLDYGCGSGILAIGAARFGAASIDAVDIDPLAIEATRTNARINDVALRVGLPDAAQGRYDLVLANILATPLKLLAPVLCGHLESGGDLVLAGLLERQAEEIAAVYAPLLELTASDHEDGWVLLTGTAPPTRVASSSR